MNQLTHCFIAAGLTVLTTLMASPSCFALDQLAAAEAQVTALLASRPATAAPPRCSVPAVNGVTDFDAFAVMAKKGGAIVASHPCSGSDRVSFTGVPYGANLEIANPSMLHGGAPIPVDVVLNVRMSYDTTWKLAGSGDSVSLRFSAHGDVQALSRLAVHLTEMMKKNAAVVIIGDMKTTVSGTESGEPGSTFIVNIETVDGRAVNTY